MKCIFLDVSKSLLSKFINWLTKIDEKKNEKKRMFTTIGKGFSLDDLKEENFKDINLNNDYRKGHIIGFGTTGAGKSRLIENMCEQDILEAGNCVVIIDPKIDNGLLSRVYQSAVRSGNEKAFMLLSPVHPKISIKINPMSNYFMDEEIIGHIVSAVETSGDVFFYNIALEVSTAIVKSRLLIKKYTGDTTPLNFREIYKYVGYEGLTTLKDNLEKITNSRDAELEDMIILINNVIGSNADYFAKVVSTLRTTLTQMSTGSIGAIFGGATKNRFIDMLENDEKVILYVQTPSMLSKKTSDITAKVCLSMIQSCIGRKAVADETFKHGLSIYIDEASNTLYQGIENLFNKSRSTNTRITALSQNYADFIDAVGREKAAMILGNANGKIFMRLVDPATASEAALYSKEIVKWDSVISTNGIMSKQTYESALKSEHFLNLKPREFYYFGMEGQFKGKTTPIGDTEIKIIPPKVA
ncbi:type IV secretory system conjugative DNA transfer family protein [Aliarcobacter skirrowii]|uniref:type IV secretory system conjugative DNA transfer family protein n=1 Tax=Aliarcobacter skirrowii TaxID=28200 RepID=UPI0029B465DF|nr:TraM recognition domain-containing protein [Aliarcobacter skirrowii]MDX4028321.1 TraM recognition domain-containing protein [Aliarcobacter skirrowii]